MRCENVTLPLVLIPTRHTIHVYTLYAADYKHTEDMIFGSTAWLPPKSVTMVLADLVLISELVHMKSMSVFDSPGSMTETPKELEQKRLLKNRLKHTVVHRFLLLHPNPASGDLY